VSAELDRSHNPQTRSWIESANGPAVTFPIQNLPFGVFRRRGTSEAFRGGVAIGDRVLDLSAVATHFEDDVTSAAAAAREPTLNRLMSFPDGVQRALRLALFDALSNEASRTALEPHCLPLDDVEHDVPANIGDFTDFYASIDHATNAGAIFRPQNPLLPNYKYVPIAYHGRSSSIVPSGTAFVRPQGQLKSTEDKPRFEATRRLDYEAEIGLYVGEPNTWGRPIPIGDAERHVFGFCLLNDWSARDIQAWEYQPLGPFLGKNFATTVSPWIITRSALAPFRRAPRPRPAQDPSPLPYLTNDVDAVSGAYDIRIFVAICTEHMRAANMPPYVLSESTFGDAYWTPAQMLAHHTSNGCSLRTGDLIGSGTLSGPGRSSVGSLLELSRNGQEPLVLPSGEQRTFLEDGDEVYLSAHCVREGFASIGFGECRGVITPSTFSVC